MTPCVLLMEGFVHPGPPVLFSIGLKTYVPDGQPVSAASILQTPCGNRKHKVKLSEST